MSPAARSSSDPAECSAADPPERSAADPAGPRAAVPPSPAALALAAGAAARYGTAAIDLLADLVAFRTVAAPPVPNVDLPEFHRLKAYLAGRAGDLGLDCTDHGAAVVIGLGSAPDRLGLLTHADVQPADPVRWGGDPFRLDTVTEPGRLVGRGVEDDKASIATALYAMRGLADRGPVRRRRVELIISMTEESDWTPFREFLRGWRPPPLNVALDGEYPVVTAEKGTGSIRLTLSPEAGREDGGGREPSIARLRGGAFRTQIPGEAEALIERAGPDLAPRLRAAIDPAWGVTFDFEADAAVGRGGAVGRDGAVGRGGPGGRLRVRAHGLAAHSSTPHEGRNAITHLAALLGTHRWPPTPGGRMVALINDLVGTGDHAERFGDLPHAHDFMGPLTLALTTLDAGPDGSLTAGLNVRRPVGRSRAEVETAIRAALDGWRERTGARLEATVRIGEPYYVESAPHVPILLGVFRHYTGDHAARPIAVGGGTQARLLPNGVNFGPSMPGTVYTGHSDHEFMTAAQLRLNLTMCTAVLAELAG